MKLIVNLKLNPTKEQFQAFKQTLERANQACNWISQIAWDNKTFGQFKLHKLVYNQTKEKFELSAQVVVRQIAKVADAYKIDKKIQRAFKKHGSISYDDRIITFKKGDRVSIWTLEGRLTIPFQCGEYQRKYLPYRKGEIDLVYRKGEFYLNCVCEVEVPPTNQEKDFLGVDFGIINLACDSDGEQFSGKSIDEIRRTFAHRRRNLQRKQTKSAKRKLKQLSGKQQNFQKTYNHQISTALVLKAKRTNRGIAIENLDGISKRVRVKKSQRARLSNWSFYELRNQIEYKAKMHGVKVVVVDPRNSSRECSRCGFVDKQNRKSQDQFSCQNCGHQDHADINAALNLRARAASDSQTGLQKPKVAYL